MCHACLSAPWTYSILLQIALFVPFAVTIWHMSSRGRPLIATSKSLSISVWYSIVNNSSCQLMGIPHHVGLVVWVEMFRNMTKSVIIWSHLLVLPVSKLLLSIPIGQLLSLNELSWCEWIKMRAELILYFNRNLFDLLLVFCEKF